ncbi:MAG: flagellar basal body-associated FliL family protein [Desulfobacteraceae bacterium]|nr:flagellar basal body-associated FliL family protein [Desulfobacteraceae bacterium]
MAKKLLEDMADESNEQVPGGSRTSAGEKFKNRFQFIKNLSKRNLVTSGAVLLVILAAGAWFFFYPAPAPDKNEMAATTISAEDLRDDEQLAAMLQESDDAVFTDILTLEPFELLSLKSTSTMAHVDMDIALELIDPAVREQLVSMKNRIYDIVQGQVREATWFELRTPQGKIQLKYDLLQRINSLFATPVVRNVYLTKFLMQ